MPLIIIHPNQVGHGELRRYYRKEDVDCLGIDQDTSIDHLDGPFHTHPLDASANWDEWVAVVWRGPTQPASSAKGRGQERLRQFKLAQSHHDCNCSCCLPPAY